MFELEQGDIENLKGAVWISFNHERSPFYVVHLEGENLDQILSYFPEHARASLEPQFIKCKKADSPRCSVVFGSQLPYRISDLDVIDGGLAPPEFSNLSNRMREIADDYFLIYKEQGLARDSWFRELGTDVLKKELLGLTDNLVGVIEVGDIEPQRTFEYAIRTLAKGIPAGKAFENLIGIAKTRHPRRDALIALYIIQICASYERNIENALKYEEAIKRLLNS